MLLGRSLETEALVANLRDHRLVTVVGPGGVGKTTLARHVLDHLDTPDLPAYFVDLTEFPASGLLERIAGELGFGSFDALIGAKADDELLLVLDNCEHLLDPVAAAIETFMQRCPNLKILSTSREPIELPGELLFHLEPLPLDGDPSDAARLFIERARLRGKEITGDLETVQAICEVLDGLPLAIELAAAKTASMTPHEILEGLDRPIELLENQRSRRPQRHGSLGAAIEWSYDLLSDIEQEAIARLSVFEGHFSMPMAKAAIDRPDAASIIDELVAKSLVVHQPLQGQSWFRMLETIRAYAGEKLSERGQEAEVWERVVVEVLAELEAQHIGPVRIPPIIKYGFVTTRRVLETCLERDVEPKRVSRLIGHLWWLEDIGHQPDGADLAARAIAKWPAPSPHTAISYGVLAGFQRLAGHVEESEQNARIAIGASSGLGAAFGHRSLGQSKRRRGEWTAALEHFTAAATSARNDGEDGLALEIQLHTAITTARAGDPQSAIAHLESVVDESEPYPLLRQWSRLFLSWILITTDLQRSRMLAKETLATARQTDDPWVTAVAQQHLGVADLLDGDIESATIHLRNSLEGFLTVHNRSDIALTIISIAALLNRRGDRTSAERTMILLETYGTDDRYGEFEQELFDKIGPLPQVTNRIKPMTNAELLRLLQPGSDHSTPQPASTGNRLKKQGDLWNVHFRGAEAVVSDSKGMSDIKTLIAQCGKEVSCLDLMQSAVAPGRPDEVSDEAARSQYQRRIIELQEEIAEAEDANDPYRSDRARTEMDELVAHLTAAYGLRGRSRPEKDPAERARSAVTSRIRATIKRMHEIIPDLAIHLDQSIKTGRFCVYDPPEPIRWEL